MKYTQKEIAKRLGISTATVSRALRNDPAINAKTREKVHTLADSLQVHSSGRSLEETFVTPHRIIGVFIKKRETHKYGLEDDEVTATYFKALTELAPKKNVTLVFHIVNEEMMPDITAAKNLPPLMNEGLMNGIILIHEFTEQAVASLKEKLPCVTVIHEKKGVDHLDVDNAAVIDLAMNQLMTFLPNNIGFFGYKKDRWVDQKYNYYIAWMYRHKLAINEDLVLDDNEEGLQKIKELIKKGHVHWYISYERLAYKLYRWLIDNNMQHKVKIVATNGLMPSLNCPQLTTVKLPLKQLAQEALHQILLKIDNPTAPAKKIILSPKLIHGLI